MMELVIEQRVLLPHQVGDTMKIICYFGGLGGIAQCPKVLGV